MLTQSKKKGFVTTIVLIIIALALLKYVFNITPMDIWKYPITQDIWSIVKELWNLLWQAVLISIGYIKVALDWLKNFLGTLKK